MKAQAEQSICPFGIDKRFCEHQETRASDLFSAIKGDLIFICKLDKTKNCPEMKQMFDETLGLRL